MKNGRNRATISSHSEAPSRLLPFYLSHKRSFLKPSIISRKDFPSPRSISTSTSSIRALSSSNVYGCWSSSKTCYFLQNYFFFLKINYYPLLFSSFPFSFCSFLHSRHIVYHTLYQKLLFIAHNLFNFDIASSVPKKNWLFNPLYSNSATKCSRDITPRRYHKGL